VHGLDDLEAGILQDVNQCHPNEGFVLYDENERARVGRGL
jgi:hypothetical protein